MLAIWPFIFLFLLLPLFTYASPEWCLVSSDGDEPKYEECLPDGDTLVDYLIEVKRLEVQLETLVDDVTIKIQSTGRETKPITIVSPDGTIIRQHVERIDVGDPSALEIDYGGSNWQCSKITVYKGARYWMFDCVEPGDGSSKATLLLSGNKVYTLTIQTGTRAEADTVGRLTIQLLGAAGKTNAKVLAGNFTIGSLVMLQVNGADVGQVHGLILTNDAIGDPWYCEDVRVSTTHSVDSFPVKRWIGDPYESSVEVSNETQTTYYETAPIDVQCHTRAIDLYSGMVRKPFSITVSCPLNCAADPLIHVLGSSLHPSTATICGSAIFDGVLTQSGGQVTVFLAPPVPKYFGSKNSAYSDLTAEAYEPPAHSVYFSFFTALTDSIDYIDSDVRLVDSFGKLTSFGRLEVLRNGKWGTVCNKGKFGAFNTEAATLVCQRLGFKHGAKVVEPCSSVNGQNLCAPFGYNVAYAGLMCLGTEDSISKCIIEEPTIDCKGHKDDVVIKCSNSEIGTGFAEGTLRLVDSSGAATTTGTGRLEIYLNGSFGSICNEGWNLVAEKVACLEMGYKGLHRGGAFHKTCEDVGLCAPLLNKIAAVGFQCKGHEARLVQCPHDASDDVYCTHHQDVIVACAGDGDPSEFRAKHAIEPYKPRYKKAAKIIDLTCYDTLDSHAELQGALGHYIVTTCPQGCGDEPLAIYGTYIYTGESPICKSAVHAGMISNENGGEVVVIRGINQAHYFGSNLNGVESSSASRNMHDTAMHSFLVARAPRELVSKQLRVHGQQRDNKEKNTYITPLESRNQPSDFNKFIWTPQPWFKGFNGKPGDYIDASLYPGSEPLKTFKDVTFIVDLVATATVGRWNTIFSFQGCGGLLVSIDNFGELVLQANCRAKLVKTGYVVPLGKRLSLAILYVASSEDLGIFVNDEMILHKHVDLDLEFSGGLIIGKNADSNSDYFMGQIQSLQAYDFVMTPKQLVTLVTESRQNMHHSGIRTTVHGNVCTSACVATRPGDPNGKTHVNTFVGVNDHDSDIEVTAPTNPAIILTCHETLENEHFNGATGSEFLVYCSRSCVDAQVPLKGSRVYSDDSSVCKAAHHAGILPKEGGEVVVRVRVGQAEYHACVGHYGLVSKSCGATARAFSLSRAPRLVHLDCHDNAILVLQMHAGSRLLLECPPGCAQIEPRMVYGSGPYSPLSSLCQAAIHSGKLDDGGGQVEVQVGPAQQKFDASFANGIQSKSADAYLRSFDITRATKRLTQFN